MVVWPYCHQLGSIELADESVANATEYAAAAEERQEDVQDVDGGAGPGGAGDESTGGDGGNDAGDCVVHGVEQIMQEGGQLLQRLRSSEAKDVVELLMSDRASPIARVLQEQIAVASPVADRGEGMADLAQGMADLVQEGCELLGRLESDEAREVASIVANRSESPLACALLSEVSKTPIKA